MFIGFDIRHIAKITGRTVIVVEAFCANLAKQYRYLVSNLQIYILTTLGSAKLLLPTLYVVSVGNKF